MLILFLSSNHRAVKFLFLAASALPFAALFWHTFLPRQFFTHVSLGSACDCFLTISLLGGFYSLSSFPFLGSRRIFGPLRIWLFIQYLFEFFLEMFCWDSESINLAEHFQMLMATILWCSRKCLHSSQGKLVY